MSIFGSIMNRIFHTATPAADAVAEPAAQLVSTAETPPPAAAAPAPSAPPTSTPSQPVDVEAVLTRMAAQKGNGGNWRTSIVDLLKLLDLDSSLGARKALANELGLHAGADGSAEENIALHKAVMQKLADNGGTVPDSLKG